MTHSRYIFLCVNLPLTLQYPAPAPGLVVTIFERRRYMYSCLYISLFRINKTIDYRKIVHYPKDGKYTIKKLPMTKLGGRHPVTRRKVRAMSTNYAARTRDSGSGSYPHVIYSTLIRIIAYNVLDPYSSRIRIPPKIWKTDTVTCPNLFSILPEQKLG